jgi:hypothetical protein
MKISRYVLLSIFACASLSACAKKVAVEDQGAFHCVSVVITIADKQVNSVVEWNSKTGEARLLNAASFADKSTGQQGNLIGWVPLTDLQQAVQNLASQIQSQQAAKGAKSPSPEKSGE